MTAPLRIDGLVAATFAPMHGDGELRLEVVPRLVDRLVDDGVRGLYVSGTTGEGESLSAAERRAVAESYVTAAAGRLPVLVQVGHNSYAEARGLAAHAQRIGADGISALAPSYFKPVDVDLLVEHLRRIADAAPELPFYYYHLPRFTGVDLDMVALLQRGAERLPSLAGIKYSVPDVVQFSACAVLDGGRYELLWGCDELLLTGLCSGARGAIGSTYNFAAPLYRHVLEAHAAGDLDAAGRWQARAVALVEVLLRYRGLPAFKAAMGLLGIDVGPCRLPLRALDDAEVAALRRDLAAIGFPGRSTSGTG